MDVGDLVDRTIYSFLEPPEEQWIRTRLTADVDDSTTSWSIDTDLLGFAEAELLGPGVLVEAGSEQAFAVSLDGTTLTVRRGARGTTKAAHSDGDDVLVAPPFTRKTVFDAVCESIVALHPPLFAYRTTKETVGEDGITEIPDDVLMATEVRRLDHHTTAPFDDLGDYEDGRTLRIYHIPKNEAVWVTYRARFPYPVSEDQTLTQLGVRDEWARIVVVGAAAQLISSRPLSTSQQEHVSGMLRTEGYPVETPSRIRDSLLRFQQFLTERAAASLSQQHPAGVVSTS